MTEVLIVPTGTANIASVCAAFRRLGASPVVSEDKAALAAASHVMLPGVGAFGASMERLRTTGLDEVLKARIGEDLPTMAICVGHQLLFETSDESPGERGLGIAPGHVGRFGDDVRVPQFGWNKVTAAEDCDLLEDGYAYFANSYRVAEPPAGCAKLVEVTQLRVFATDVPQPLYTSQASGGFRMVSCVGLQLGKTGQSAAQIAPRPIIPGA